MYYLWMNVLELIYIIHMSKLVCMCVYAGNFVIGRKQYKLVRGMHVCICVTITKQCVDYMCMYVCMCSIVVLILQNLGCTNVCIYA